MEEWNTPQQAQRFVENYADTILRLCLTYSISREDAQDVCQEVFLKLLEGRWYFQDQEHEKAFILRSAINVCKDILKSAARRRTCSLEGAQELPVPAQELPELLEAVQRLPRHYGTAMYLFYYEGYSLNEIAKICGCTPAAARKRLSRARKLLAQQLEVDYGTT